MTSVDSSDLDEFYILEHDGRMRPASPGSRRSSSEYEHIDPAEMLDHGAFVYIEDNDKALYFDGLEVRELYFDALRPVPQTEGGVNSTLLSQPAPVTSDTMEPTPTADGHSAGTTTHPALLRSSSGSATDGDPSPSTPQQSDTPAEPLRPEVQEFLARIRSSGMGLGAGPRLAGLRTFPIGPMSVLYPSLLGAGLLLPLPRSKQSSTSSRTTNQFDDSYYTRTTTDDEDIDPLPAGETETEPLSPSSRREPHLFYLRRGGGHSVDSSTVLPR